MNLLNRYLFGQFLKYFFTVNAGFAAIYLLVDFFEKIDDFTNAGKPLALALEYSFLTIPFVVDQLGPVIILLSGVISLGILNHTNELTALKAGGVPLRLITKPLIVGSVVFTLLFLAAAQWLLPTSISRTNNIWYEQVKGKVPLGIKRNNRYYYEGRDGFYSFNWPNPKEYTFENFSYSQWDEKYNIKRLTTAAYAKYRKEDNIWVLNVGQIQEKVDGTSYQISNFMSSHRIFLSRSTRPQNNQLLTFSWKSAEQMQSMKSVQPKLSFWVEFPTFSSASHCFYLVYQSCSIPIKNGDGICQLRFRQAVVSPLLPGEYGAPCNLWPLPDIFPLSLPQLLYTYVFHS